VFSIDGVNGAIQHANYSPVSASSPAQPGEVVIVYATGLGPVSEPVSTGQFAPTVPLALVTQLVSVSVGGEPAQVLFAGLAPGEVGVYQLNIQIPGNIASGPQDLVLSLPPATDEQPPYFSPASYPRISAPVKITIQ
jgi:uncharacterized protein (TIGR03437 family)